MTFLELQNELRTRLSASSNSTFWTTDMLKTWLNLANQWACAYKPWPFTEGAKYLSTVANQVYYDYPESFRSDSLTRLTVADSSGNPEVYTKIRYNDFMKYRQDNPDGTDQLFTDYNKEYFINPIPTTDGLEIVVWGQQVPDQLVNDGDTTPFASGNPEGEEAIIKRALMYAQQKAGRYDKAGIERDEATLVLKELWDTISKNQAGYQTKDRPFFKSQDFFN